MTWLHSAWSDLWPSIVAPSLWTILAITVSHIRTRRKLAGQHEAMKQHVTATMAGPREQA